MSDRFEPIPVDQLLLIILKEIEDKSSLFGIPDDLFFKPKEHTHLSSLRFGQRLASPIGVAAGPHTQLAANIIASWVMGARYIELKTVQTLDELDVPKPCIDMEDEGYNCEWSQELKIEQSYDEYLKAWVIIHILNHKLFGNDNPGTIFNMSAGYNLEGILKDNMQWFFTKMNDSTNEIQKYKKLLAGVYPPVNTLNIPAKISDNITLSTMHGCPPDEIESIASYLMEKKGLHTFVKLNPTLLGPDLLREILNDKLKFKTSVPDIAFEHDLKFNDAVRIIKSLTATAKKEKLCFGLKLTNTLESVNQRNVFGGDVEMMYMSGRALHPLAVTLGTKLQAEFDDKLDLSFSAGADAFNVHELLASGFGTITICSDLLKPGGYMRLNQYYTELKKRFTEKGAGSIEAYINKVGGSDDTIASASKNLNSYAVRVCESDYYKREFLRKGNIKGEKPLEYFDCISAPCVENCGTSQDIPEYLHFAAKGSFGRSFNTILRTNPFPTVTGMVCDHLCQERCTRVNYDNAVKIREVKRYVSELDEITHKYHEKKNKRVAIIGAGPSGLSCAYYLSHNHYNVDVFEEKNRAGGMVRFAIPGFRLTEEAIEKDIDRIEAAGARIHFGVKVDNVLFDELRKEYDYIYVAAGAAKSARLKNFDTSIKGILDPLYFLFKAKERTDAGLGKSVVIIGGGNSAMDAARTAFRLVPEGGTVTIVYRRTINEMPADKGEIKAVIEEGIKIVELASPIKPVIINGQVISLLCNRMKLSAQDETGRARTEEIPGAEFQISCDTIIPAIGQVTDLSFLPEGVRFLDAGNHNATVKNLFIGGDAMRGASTAIKAIGDGRRVAEQIIEENKGNQKPERKDDYPAPPLRELMIKRAVRNFSPPLWEPDLADRKNFRLISRTMDVGSVIKEAERCLYCDIVCNICTTVCPNMANYSYKVTPGEFPVHSIKGSNKNGINIAFTENL